MADDSLQDLSRQLQLARRSLEEMARAARESASETDKVGTEAEGASSGVATLNRAVNSVTEAFGNLSRMGAEAVTGALSNFVQNIPQAAASAERHQTALRQLGAAYGYVQQATNGAVSAEQAAMVQQRALQSGLRLSAQELAAVAARAREYANATGTDLNQALEQLADNLVDPGEELRKFGVFLQAGQSAGDNFRQALQQIQEQAARTAPAQTTLAEATEQATRAQREATDALSGFIAQSVGLRDFFTQFTSFITEASTETQGFSGHILALKDTIVGVIREVANMDFGITAAARRAGQLIDLIPGGAAARRRAEAALSPVTSLPGQVASTIGTAVNAAIGLGGAQPTARGQSGAGGFIEQAGPLAQQLRSRGFNLRGVQLGQLGQQASPEERQQLLQLLQRTAATGTASRVAQQQELDRVIAQVTASSDLRRVNEQARAIDEAERARREREAEIARRNAAEARQQASRRASAGRGDAEADRRAREEADRLSREPFRRQPTDTAGLASFFAGFRPGAEAVTAGLGTADIATRSAREREASARAAQESLDFTARRQEAERQLLLAGGQEAAAGALQVRVLRERRDALQQLLDANTAYLDQARNAHASEQSLNDLMTQRIGIQTALAETTRNLTEEQAQLSTTQQFVLDKSSELAGVLGGSLVEAAFAAQDAQANASATFAKVIADQTRSFLRSSAQQSTVSALQETAKGVGQLAIGNVPGALVHFKSAGLHAVAAAAAGLGAAAMGPQTQAAAAASAGAAGGATTPSSARADDRQTSGGGPLNLTINVSGAAFTDIGVQQAVGSALREAVGTGVIRRDQLVGLFGG